MKITVNTLGTRGDIQPYIALSLGLQQAGHSVRILTHQIFEAFVEEYGLDVYPLLLDPRQVVINQALSELGNNTSRINPRAKAVLPKLRSEAAVPAYHSTHWALSTMSHFVYPSPLFHWMLDLPLAPSLQFVSIQGRFAQIAFLPVSGLLWLAFWLYNVSRFICKKAALSWQGALISK